jgi:hypothetical protein
MLTKTKEKKDKVSELLQGKKEKFSVFIVFCFAEIGLSLTLISHLHVPALFSPGEIFFSDVAERKRKPCTEDCKIKLQLYRPHTHSAVGGGGWGWGYQKQRGTYSLGGVEEVNPSIIIIPL